MYNVVHICRKLLASGRRYFSFRGRLPSVRSRGRKGLGLPGFYCPNASSQIPRIVYISRALRAISCMLGPGGFVKVDGPLANARCTQCGFALRLRSHHLARSCAVSALAGRPGPRRRPCAAVPPVWPSNGIQLRAAPPAWRSECLRRKCRAHGVHIWPRGSGRCAWSRVVVGPHIPTAWLLLRVPMGAASPACLRVCRHQLRVSDSLAEG